MSMIPVIFEMETSDPDDFMTLLWLADNPKIDLKAVVVTPGSKDQCQLVRWGLDHCGQREIPIGALHGPEWWDTQDGKKLRVSGFHYPTYGEEIKKHDVGWVCDGPELIDELAEYNMTVLVGSPPKNLGAAFRRSDRVYVSRWVQQGGFAGDNMVEKPLEKFKGRLTCPSFNPGGAPNQVMDLLQNKRISVRLFVSKNVCHGVTWTHKMQSELKSRIKNRRTGLETMIKGLDTYLEKKGVAKAMHDIVAACCVVDDSVCEFKKAEIYREKGEWGARPYSPTAFTVTKISVGFDEEKFLSVLSS